MKLEREIRIALDDALFESGASAGAPERRTMDNTVADRSTVGSRASLERSRDAHELAFDRAAAEADDRIAVAAHIQKCEVRRQIGIRDASGGGGIAGALVFEARAYAVMQQEIHGRSRASVDIRHIKRTQRMVPGKPM